MFDLLLKQVAEAWASFSSEVKKEGNMYSDSFYVLGIFTLSEMMSLKTLHKLLWGFPKETESPCMNICNDIDMWEWIWTLETP